MGGRWPRGQALAEVDPEGVGPAAGEGSPPAWAGTSLPPMTKSPSCRPKGLHGAAGAERGVSNRNESLQRGMGGGLPVLGGAFGHRVVRSRKDLPGEGTAKTNVQVCPVYASVWQEGRCAQDQKGKCPGATWEVGLQLLLQAGPRPLHSDAVLPGKMAVGLGEAGRPFLL